MCTIVTTIIKSLMHCVFLTTPVTYLFGLKTSFIGKKVHKQNNIALVHEITLYFLLSYHHPLKSKLILGSLNKSLELTG